MVKPASDRVFPKVLYMILQDAPDRGFLDVVSWNAHGKSFKIHNRERFMNETLVDYGIFQSQYKSLVRQLNLWGFQCVHGGRKNAERGSYYHKDFRRGQPELLDKIERAKVKVKPKQSQNKTQTSNTNMDKDQNVALNDIVQRTVTPGSGNDYVVRATFWEECDWLAGCSPVHHTLGELAQQLLFPNESVPLAADLLQDDLFR